MEWGKIFYLSSLPVLISLQSFIKIFNVGKKVVASNINGFLPSQCVFYLMQIHIQERTLWLTRHGESEYNVDSRVGGDPPLTEKGALYAKAMTSFIKARYPPSSMDFHVWTSTLHRTMASIAGIESGEYDIKHMKFLNEISSGICDNMTYVTRLFAHYNVLTRGYLGRNWENISWYLEGTAW